MCGLSLLLVLILSPRVLSSVKTKILLAGFCCFLVFLFIVSNFQQFRKNIIYLSIFISCPRNVFLCIKNEYHF